MSDDIRQTERKTVRPNGENGVHSVQ